DLDVAREHPDAAPEERHADLLADAAPLAREERRGDRAGQAEPRHVIAHARALRGRRPLGLAERAHDPRPGPEGGIVEGRALALRALGAVAGEAGVDEAWMHAPERRVGHAEHGGGRGHGDPDAERGHAHAVEGSRHGGRPCHGRAPFCKPAGPCYTARMAEQAQVLGPTSHYFYSQRLKLHYVDWGNADEPP